MNLSEKELYEELVNREFCVNNDLDDFLSVLSGSSKQSAEDFIKNNDAFNNLYKALNRYGQNYKNWGADSFTVEEVKSDLIDILYKENYYKLIAFLSGDKSDEVFEVASQITGQSSSKLMGWEVMNTISANPEEFKKFNETLIKDYLEREKEIKKLDENFIVNSYEEDKCNHR